MALNKYDMSGNDLIIDQIYVGASTPGATGTTLSGSEISVLDGVTAGTVTASKALVVGSSKQIGSLGTVTLADAANVVVNATTGTKIGTATSQKLGFFNATPIIQPASANQAAVTTTVGSAVAATGSTQTTPYGYAQAQADAIVSNVNALRVDLLAMNTLLTQVRADLVALGFEKGSA